MEALRFKLEVPFWCSFSDFGSLNIKLTYPFPPPTALFGLIQNAMKLPSLHTLPKEDAKQKNDAKIVEKKYIHIFNSLRFGITINNFGEKIEDFSNIHKGNRERESVESELETVLKGFVRDLPISKEDKKDIKINKLKLNRFNKYYQYNVCSDNDKLDFDKAINNIRKHSCEEIFNIIGNFWEENFKGTKGFNLNKTWLSTQIHRQKIINPIFTIYLYSNIDDGEWSIKNIYNNLKNPKRSLYIGESDDVVNILNLEIVELNQTNNSKIHSVIPGIYENSELVKVPTKLKYDVSHPNEHYKICSIPKGDINESLESYSYNGENIVFI